jgi:hypothetical protein
MLVVDDADIGNSAPGELPPEARRQPRLELTYDDGRKTVFEGP